MKINKIINKKELKKWLVTNYGKRCKEYVIGCWNCMAWRTWDELEILFMDKVSHKMIEPH